MPAIKVLDRNANGQRRRPQLWECFGEINVNPIALKEGRGIFYAIVHHDKMEECLKEESKNIFRENGFEITPPIEYNALKSIVVRHMDKVQYLTSTQMQK